MPLLKAAQFMVTIKLLFHIPLFYGFLYRKNCHCRFSYIYNVTTIIEPADKTRLQYTLPVKCIAVFEQKKAPLFFSTR